MSCKRISKRAKREQDYWLSFSDFPWTTKEERIDFLRFDSHGGETPNSRTIHINNVPILNHIFLGKRRHDQFINIVRDSYCDMEGGWIGGLDIVAEEISTGIVYRDIKNPFRFWITAFNEKTVYRWLSMFLYHVFGWRPNIILND